MNQKGVSIIVVIAAMLILVVMGAVLISLVITGSDVSVNQLRSSQAFQIAEGGKEYALKYCALPDYGFCSVVDKSLGDGKFTAQTFKHITTVIDNPLSAVSAVLNVASTVGFLIPGVIKIDDEYIFCQKINSPVQFVSCVRGYGGSVAAVHPLASSVVQYVITSTGVVGDARRVVSVVVDEL